MSPTVILTNAKLEHLDVVARYSNIMNSEDGHPASPNNKKALKDLIESPEWGMVKLIELDQKIIGYLAVCYGYSIEYGGREVALDEIYIEPAYRGKGYGSQAIMLIEEELKQTDFVSFYLVVSDKNETAKAVYKKMGFEPLKFNLLAKFYKTL